MNLSETLPSLPVKSDAFVCHVDQRPCEIAAEITPHLRAGRGLPLLEEFAEGLPCSACRACAMAAGELRGQRLGRRERDVLLRAAPPDAIEGAPVVAERATRAEAEATLRALRTLHRRGLVTYGRGARGERTVWRSPLGGELVFQYGAEFASGDRVRWDMRVVNAANIARRSVPELLVRFGDHLRAVLGDAKEHVERADVFANEDASAIDRARELLRAVEDAK